MTGPEHYREAEKLLSLDEAIREGGGDPGDVLHAAQVHATLALAAATADQPAQAPADALMRRAWRTVTGPFVKAAAGGAR